ncbi:hypothetical protein L207DRAFT_549890 [Hyaloscypha variabilis F]|uniref:Uncharacterized protein n=1 Tax=Hyaloscypha variabilis (strain UAMH 11265 / GT02V1 / F) TaxID=1149755 RepID=A0A2J6QSQ3_HYAVF|nr:hypothetical protein L207DRAFT_549890 [Hyaloscypha variabilis F]
MVLGCLTPLGEFISLRSRRRKLARADPPSFLARWSDDGRTLYYNDTSISMDNFRTFGHSLVDRVEALCGSLMFGWFPRVDLNQRDLAATELLSLEYCNGQLSQRGIYVYNGFMIYVIQYYKAKRSTNNEFTVIRFLLGRLGKLLFYYLTYIRLFIIMVEREISMSPTRVLSSLLFCTFNKPHRLWPFTRLSDILAKSNTGLFEKPLNIRLYRQLSIYVTEKHIKRLAKPFNNGHRPLQRGFTYRLDGAFPSQIQPALLNIYKWASVE